MKRRAELLLSLSLLFGSLNGCNRADLASRELTGFSKVEVRRVLGEPHEKSELVKEVEHLLGPMETLWDQLEPGESLEIWVYMTRAGRKELYFLPTSDRVAGEFFWYENPRKNPVF